MDDSGVLRNPQMVGQQIRRQSEFTPSSPGIDIADQQPKILTPRAVQASDLVITLGCGDACPVFSGKRYEDWQLDDPAGQGIASVRPIRDDIRRRVLDLLGELRPASSTN